MFCKLCGKPVFAGNGCLLCGAKACAHVSDAASVSLPPQELLTDEYVPEKKEEVVVTNKMASVGLVLSCIPYLFFVGFILDIIAFRRAIDLGGAGKNKATVGIVIVFIWLNICFTLQFVARLIPSTPLF